MTSFITTASRSPWRRALPGLVLAGSMVLAGCSSGTDVTTEPPAGDDGGLVFEPADNGNEDSMTDSNNDDPTGTDSESAEATEAGSDDGSGSTDASPGSDGDPATLERLLIDEVAGFNRVDDPGADTFLDLAAAANRQPDPSEEEPLLQTRGFRGGWTRAFRNDTQDVVIATVYTFADAAEADFYMEDGLIIVGGYGGERFDIEGFPEVEGFRQESSDAIGPLITHGITFTDGPNWYLLFVYGDPATATVDIVIDAARDQLSRAQAG